MRNITTHTEIVVTRPKLAILVGSYLRDLGWRISDTLTINGQSGLTGDVAAWERFCATSDVRILLCQDRSAAIIKTATSPTAARFTKVCDFIQWMNVSEKPVAPKMAGGYHPALTGNLLTVGCKSCPLADLDRLVAALKVPATALRGHVLLNTPSLEATIASVAAAQSLGWAAANNATVKEVLANASKSGSCIRLAPESKTVDMWSWERITSPKYKDISGAADVIAIIGGTTTLPNVGSHRVVKTDTGLLIGGDHVSTGDFQKLVEWVSAAREDKIAG